MFDEPARIPTHLSIEAKIREISAQGIGVYITHQGEKMGGLILLKLSDMAGECKLLTQQRNLDGMLEWTSVFTEEVVEDQRADEYITRATGRDPDLWVIEIEHKEMPNPFEG